MIEFQQTGFLVSRMHAASFGGFPQKLRMQEFLLNTQAVGLGVIVGQPGWEQRLAENQQAFLDSWVNRPDFLALYAGKGNEEYVSALFANAGVGAGEEAELRQQLVAGLNSGAETRATALRKVVESRAVHDKLFNPAFVQMQYYGYLRRNPADAPDADFSGYNFWLAKLDSFNGDFIRAEMVKAFIDSIEYRKRFGQ